MVDINWSYRGLQVVRLENDLIRIDVLPELGGKIWNLIYKPADHSILWHNPHLPPDKLQYGSKFDDVWSGGWDELIPNDIPTPVAYGDILPDHGEVWSQAAKWTVLDAGNACTAVSFVSHGRVWPFRFEKIIVLKRDEPFFRVKYRCTNLSVAAFDFLWNIHPALEISKDSRIDVPAHHGFTEPWSTDLFEEGTEYTWPYVQDRNGKTVDMRVVPPPSGWADHHYLPDITAGWYAVTNTRKRIGFGISFPLEVFPHLWLFRAFGGWRGMYTLIVEISTGYPHRLTIAREQGHCSHLEAGETLETEITPVIYTGTTSVKGIAPDGTVMSGENSKSTSNLSSG